MIRLDEYLVFEMHRRLVLTFSPPIDYVTNLWIDGKRIEILRASGEGSLVGLRLIKENGRTIAREIREAAL